MGCSVYEDIFENAEVGIALNDPESGTVGRVNRHYTELLGYSRNELRSMKFAETSADDPTFNQEAAMEKVERALSGSPQTFDWLYERKDGSTFWGEVVLKQATVGDRQRLLAFVRDISDRKQYERDLEAKNQRLDEFASIVSHDLRNPLNAAAGHLDLACEECDSEHLDVVGRALSRMERLVDDVLTLSRAGDTVGETEPIDLETLTTRCWQTIDPDTARLDVRTTAAVDADRQRLRQALENLLRNAVQHSDGEVSVTVDDFERGFYVADDGPGIPPAERQQVLETGYSTAQEGTGFGLGIVQDIAAAHGWTLHVTDSSAGGARFELTGVDIK
jgi:PAS domain S-box-containing protein